MPLLRLAPYEASLLVTLVCLALTWQRRQFPGARLLAITLASQGLYTVGYIGELLSTTLAAKICWDNFQWLPSLAACLLVTLFVRAYTGSKRMPQWLLIQLGIVPIATTVLAFTNPWHHYIGTGHRLVPGWPSPALYYEYGPLMWMTMPYMIGLQGLSLGTMAGYVFSQRSVFRRQGLGILLGLAIPTLAILLAILGVQFAGYRDITPLATALGNICILWALLRYRALRLVPIARELVFDHLQLGMLVVDESRQIIDANQAAAALFDTQLTKLVGQSIDVRLARWPQIVSAIQKRRDARLEERHPDETTTRWIQIDIQPIADAMQSGHLLLLRDITEQKRAAEEVLRSREAALSASQAKSRFVATLSHEIRTPLSAVMGISRLLGESKLEPHQHDLLHKLDGATQHLLELLNHTLDFSKLEAGRLLIAAVDFDLGSLLSSITEIFWLSATDKGLTFSLVVDPDVPQKLFGDGLRLKQILVNLVGNAIKFTDRGHVELRATCSSIVGDQAKLEFLVKDTGIGLDAAQQTSLFQPFSQADATISTRFGGTGLGLSISRQLALLLGGDLSCDSQQGVGSTFRLRITIKLSSQRTLRPPAATSSPGMPALPPSELRPGQSGSSPDLGAKIALKRILLAEDNQINQIITQKMLRRIGYECDVACNGQQAIEQLMSHPPDYYAAVLMDLEMPELDGKAAVVTLRANPQLDTLPIIALTGESVTEVILDVLSCGMDDIMQKPVDLKTLGTVLKRWSESKRTDHRQPANSPSPLKPT